MQEELKSSAAAESYKTFLSIKKSGEMDPWYRMPEKG